VKITDFLNYQNSLQNLSSEVQQIDSLVLCNFLHCVDFPKKTSSSKENGLKNLHHCIQALLNQTEFGERGSFFILSGKNWTIGETGGTSFPFTVSIETVKEPTQEGVLLVAYSDTIEADSFRAQELYIPKNEKSLFRRIDMRYANPFQRECIEKIRLFSKSPHLFSNLPKPWNRYLFSIEEDVATNRVSEVLFNSSLTLKDRLQIAKDWVLGIKSLEKLGIASEITEDSVLIRADGVGGFQGVLGDFSNLARFKSEEMNFYPLFALMRQLFFSTEDAPFFAEYVHLQNSFEPLLHELFS